MKAILAKVRANLLIFLQKAKHVADLNCIFLLAVPDALSLPYMSLLQAYFEVLLLQDQQSCFSGLGLLQGGNASSIFELI